MVIHDIDLSLTENLVAPVVHAKQFDHRARKIRCRLYKNALAYPVPAGVIMSCYGTRPDGRIFQYGSDSSPELVAEDDGAVLVMVTSFMTGVHGRFPVDVSLITEDGDVISTFRFVLMVEAAAVDNAKLASLTYAVCLNNTIENISGFYITQGGYLAMISENGLSLTEGSESGTLMRVEQVMKEGIVQSTITDDGITAYESADMLGLYFTVDEEGRLIVLFGEDAEEMKNN